MFMMEHTKTIKSLYYSNLKPTEEQVKESVEMMAPAFLYAGGYVGSDSVIVLKCRVCGEMIQRSMITIRHGKCTKTCPACTARDREEKKRIEREAKEAEREAAKKARAEAEQARHYMATCRECGQLFDTTRPKAVFCCAVCARRYWNRTKDNKSRYTKNGKADYTITLQKLYARDGGVCKGCGKQIAFGQDPNADDYPSIDHIKPINKGGLHQWDNVQLMCRCCNYMKRDSWSEPPLSVNF